MQALRIIEGPLLRDLLAQPDAIAATLDRLDDSRKLARIAADLTNGTLRRVVLTGMGASLYALHALQLHLVARGYTAVLLETGELVHQQPDWLTKDTLVVAVSQSGASAEIVRLLELNRKRAVILGVTNTKGSPLDRGATCSIRTAAGAEATVSCKTYLAALVALEFVADRLTGASTWDACTNEIRGLLPWMRDYLPRWQDYVMELRGKVNATMPLFYLGRGPSLATALAAGLITKEAAQCAAEGMSCAAFRHGPRELLDSYTQTVIFAGPESTIALNRRLCDEIAATGASAFWCGPDAEWPMFRIPPVSAALLPLVEILPVQMLTILLSALRHHEAGAFTRATKITREE